MNRRYLLKGAAAVALLIPGRSKAQGRSSPRRVGFLAGGIRPEDLGSSLYGGFMKGMSQLGYVEGKDYLIEWRFAEGKYERFPGLAEELVKSGPDVIVTSAMAAVRPSSAPRTGCRS